MKNISLALNGILLIAVAVLYYFQFKGSSEPAESKEQGQVFPTELRIAYINSDSVLANYEYFKKMAGELEAKGQTFDQDLRNRMESLQREITAYQQNVNNLTLNQARATEEDLGQKQQNLQMYQQNLSQQLAQEEAKLNEELYYKVTGFLKEYGDENGIHVVLKLDPSSDVLYGVEGLDITKDVIAGLNEAYSTEQDSVTTD